MPFTVITLRDSVRKRGALTFRLLYPGGHGKALARAFLATNANDRCDISGWSLTYFEKNLNHLQSCRL